MSIAFIIGAGCSAGTLRPDRCPAAAGFGAALAKRKGYSELHKVARHLNVNLAEAGLEEIWTCIDYHAKFQRVFSVEWSWQVAAVELKNALLELYGEQCNETVESLTINDSYTLGKIICEIGAGDTLISFNYDTLAERLFQKRHRGPSLRHCAGSPPDCAGSPPAGVVRFVKPHGSLSWNLNDLKREIMDGEPILDPVATGVVPLVLGAVPLKSELISEVQCCHGSPRVFEVILGHWRAVADAIRDADKLVVLGYSFPREDTYARFFYREAMRERKQHELKVEYYELRERSDQTGCSIKEAFPGVVTLDYKGKVTVAPKSAFR